MLSVAQHSWHCTFCVLVSEATWSVSTCFLCRRSSLISSVWSVSLSLLWSPVQPHGRLALLSINRTLWARPLSIGPNVASCWQPAGLGSTVRLMCNKRMSDESVGFVFVILGCFSRMAFSFLAWKRKSLKLVVVMSKNMWTQGCTFKDACCWDSDVYIGTFYLFNLYLLWWRVWYQN